MNEHKWQIVALVLLLVVLASTGKLDDVVNSLQSLIVTVTELAVKLVELAINIVVKIAEWGIRILTSWIT